MSEFYLRENAEVIKEHYGRIIHMRKLFESIVKTEDGFNKYSNLGYEVFNYGMPMLYALTITDEETAERIVKCLPEIKNEHIKDVMQMLDDLLSDTENTVEFAENRYKYLNTICLADEAAKYGEGSSSYVAVEEDINNADILSEVDKLLCDWEESFREEFCQVAKLAKIRNHDAVNRYVEDTIINFEEAKFGYYIEKVLKDYELEYVKEPNKITVKSGWVYNLYAADINRLVHLGLSLKVNKKLGYVMED